jgi:hypothetical protein
MDVLLRIEAGESSVNTGKAPNLPASTVCIIHAGAAKTNRIRSGTM